MTNSTTVYKAIEYMEAHLKDNLSIGDIADHVGFSKYHFSRVFKDLTGYTPSDYYRGRKVTEALNFMKESKCRIIDAAYEYGFNSPEVFTRSCLSAFGCSPSQIKKSIQSQSFNGLAPLDINKVTFISHFKNKTIQETEIPSILIKGHYYTSSKLFPKLDFGSQIFKELANDSDTLFQLHWAGDTQIYNHLIGIAIDINNLSNDDFNSFVYKKIPNKNYLVFPLSSDRKELPFMKDYIYDYHLPRNRYLSEVTYAAETLKLNPDQSIKSSLLYIPVRRKKNNMEHF